MNWQLSGKRNAFYIQGFSSVKTCRFSMDDLLFWNCCLSTGRTYCCPPSPNLWAFWRFLLSHLFLFSFQANKGWELAAVPRKVNSSMLAPVWWLFSVLSPELVYPSPTTGTTLGHSFPNEVLCMSYTVSGSCQHGCTWRIILTTLRQFIPFVAALLLCVLDLKSDVMKTPRSFSSSVPSNVVSPIW